MPSRAMPFRVLTRAPYRLRLSSICPIPPQVCFYSMMCSNREWLWSLNAGDEFICEMEWEGFTRMRDYVLDAMPGPGD